MSEARSRLFNSNFPHHNIELLVPRQQYEVYDICRNILVDSHTGSGLQATWHHLHYCFLVSSNMVYIVVFSHLPDLWAWSVGLCCGRQIQGEFSRMRSDVSWTHGPDVSCTRCVEMVCACRCGNNNMTHETWKLKSPMTQDRVICLGSLEMLLHEAEVASLADVAASDLWLRPTPFRYISKPDGGVSESRVGQVHTSIVSIAFHRLWEQYISK